MVPGPDPVEGPDGCDGDGDDANGAGLDDGPLTPPAVASGLVLNDEAILLWFVISQLYPRR